MVPTVIDWDDTPCPDCRRAELGECGYQSEEIRNGCAVVWTACVFSVAGRNREMVLAAVRVLAKWKMV